MLRALFRTAVFRRTRAFNFSLGVHFGHLGRRIVLPAARLLFSAALTPALVLQIAHCKAQHTKPSKFSMDALLGKWDFVSSEGFDEYLKEVGVSFVTRKVAANLKPTLIFEKSGSGEWAMTSKSTFKTFTIKFELGKEFAMETADGRKVTTVWTVENDRLVQEERGENGKNSHFERFVEDGKLKIVCECNGVKSVRVYAKAE